MPSKIAESRASWKRRSVGGISRRSAYRHIVASSSRIAIGGSDNPCRLKAMIINPGISPDIPRRHHPVEARDTDHGKSFCCHSLSIDASQQENPPKCVQILSNKPWMTRQVPRFWQCSTKSTVHPRELWTQSWNSQNRTTILFCVKLYVIFV
jgi:hypothetical protein